MPENLGSAVLYLETDDKRFKRGVKGAESSTQRMGRSMAKVGGIAAGLFAGFSVVEVVREMDDIQRANQQTQAALKRIGPAAQVSLGGIQQLAGELQQLSGIDDQVIQSGQNMLLTLGGLDVTTKQGAETFKNASKAMVNFAEATGTSADAAGKQFAKSIAAASQGTLLLPRGLKLASAEQKRLKKAFESGSTAASRQAALVEVLGKKFQGSAKLTNVERWQVLKDRLLGVGAAIGEHLMPYIDKLAAFVGRVVTQLEKLNPKTQKAIAVIVALGVAMVPVVAIVGLLAAGFGVIATAAAAVSLPVIAVIAGLVLLGAAFVALYKKSAAFRAIVQASFQNLKAGVMKVLGELKKTLAVWGTWARSFWKSHGASITNIVLKIFNGIKSFIGNALSTIKNVVIAGLRLLRGDWKGAWEAMKAALKSSLKGIKKLVVDLPIFLITTLGSIAGKLTKKALSIGKAIIDGIVKGIKAGGSKIIHAVTDLGDKALKALKKKLHIASPSRRMMREVGIPISEGVALGINRGAEKATKAAEALAEKIRNTLSKRLRASDLALAFNEYKQAVVQFAGGDVTKLMRQQQKLIMRRISSLTAFLKKNSRKLTAEAKLGILQELTSLYQQAGDIKAQLASPTDGQSNVQAMAQGGIVTRPTLALIGEAGPEAVIPLKDAKRRAPMQSRGLGGNSIVMNFRGDPDPWSASRQAAFALRSAGLVGS